MSEAFMSRGDALTPRQTQLLDTIVDFQRRHGMPPTIRELCEARGVASTNGIADALKVLERKGYLTRQHMKSRSIRLTEKTAWARDTGGICQEALAALDRGDLALTRTILVRAVKESTLVAAMGQR